MMSIRAITAVGGGQRIRPPTEEIALSARAQRGLTWSRPASTANVRCDPTVPETPAVRRCGPVARYAFPGLGGQPGEGRPARKARLHPGRSWMSNKASGGSIQPQPDAPGGVKARHRRAGPARFPSRKNREKGANIDRLSSTHRGDLDGRLGRPDDPLLRRDPPAV